MEGFLTIASIRKYCFIMSLEVKFLLFSIFTYVIVVIGDFMVLLTNYGNSNKRNMGIDNFSYYFFMKIWRDMKSSTLLKIKD